ncbi:unnamed protein product [Sphagnum balticum]
MFEVLSRRLPYPGMEQHAITFQTATCGLRPTPLPGPTAALNALITDSWAAEPTKRPTAEAIHQNLMGEIHKINNKEQLVTGSEDHTVRVWNVQTGECVHTLEGHTATVHCVAFDGNTIVSGSVDKTVCIWRAPYNTDDCKRVLNEHAGWVYPYDNVAVVGDRLVFVNESTNIEVRDVHNKGQAVHKIRRNRDIVSIIKHMSPVPDHPNLLVTGGVGGDVHLWDIETGAHTKFVRK